MSTPLAFNPLDKHNLGESVALALSRCPVHPLGEIASFKGAGIYALYYSGGFEPYKILAELNRTEASVPIYVGKAVPKGSRKGVDAGLVETSRSLCTRLRDHARTISHSPALNITDFRCRYLVVDDTWIGLCETLLIQSSAPLWNTVLDGFGRHVQGKNRQDGVSAWHVFHRGRDASGVPLLEDALVPISARVAAFMEVLQTRSLSR